MFMYSQKPSLPLFATVLKNGRYLSQQPMQNTLDQGET
jgi:hypothetical protein